MLLTTEPDDCEGWTIRGEAKIAGDPRGALADFDTALTLDPDHAPALRGKASCLSEQLNRPGEAAEVLDRIAILGAATVEDRAGYAVLLARLGKTAASREQARACLAANTPALPLYQAASALALTATTLDERREVIAILRRVIQQEAHWARQMASDPDLRVVRSEKSFQELISAGRVLAGPSSK